MREALRSVSRVEGIALVVILLAGVVLRIALWSTQSLVAVDGTTYIRMADWLAGGPAFDSVQPFGYPILIRLARFLVEDRVTAARVVDLLFGTALIPLIWLLARSLGLRGWLAVVPALATALLPVPVRYSITTLSESPYLAFLFTALLLAIRDRPFAAGGIAGMAYTIRPEGLIVAGGLAALRMRTPRAALRLALGAGLVLLAYILFQGLLTGGWEPTRKAINIGSEVWWRNEPMVGAADTSGTLDRLAAHGTESLAAYPARAARYGEGLLRHGGWIVIPMALLGISVRSLTLLPALLPLVILPFFALAAGHPRLLFPSLPFFWVLAACGGQRVPGRLRRAGWILALLLGFGTTAYLERAGYHLPEDGAFPELVQVGLWLRPHANPESVVYDRKPYTAFYAQATPRTIPIGGYDETLDAIVAAGGDFLVVDQTVVEFFRPELLPLALDKGVVGNEPRLRPIHTNFRYQGRKTILYRVVRPGGPEPFPEEAAVRKEIGYLDHWPNHYVHGVLAMRGEAWQTAAGEFTLVVRADSTRADAYNNLAWCLARLGKRLEEAEARARRALALDPDNEDYRDTLIDVLETAGKPEAARRERERSGGSEEGRTGGN